MAKLFWGFVLLAGLFCASADEAPEWPSVAQVEFRVDQVWSYQCAATVLTSYHVLSAAKCFSGSLYSAENRRIRAGSSNAVDGTVVSVVYAHIHPSFGLLGNDGDIAVVQVTAGMVLDGVNIAQVLVIGAGTEIPAGLPVDLVGWQGDQESSKAVQQTIFTHDEETCLLKYLSAEQTEFITENMICAGLTPLQGLDATPEDIGSPLFFTNVQIGLTSFGKEADNEYPLVATAVSRYTDWIEEVASSLVQP